MNGRDRRYLEKRGVTRDVRNVRDCAAARLRYVAAYRFDMLSPTGQTVKPMSRRSGRRGFA
ncbi:hypothetical protein OIV71_31720, partial [Burkholderia pseudomallei]|nr:hypothetical protein [Burkholderia pseudomallei]